MSSRMARCIGRTNSDAGARRRRRAHLPPMDADKACVTLFTSGSTGAPKRIIKTVRQLELEAEIVDRVLGPTVPRDGRVHATVVHQHLYGLTFRLCWPLATRRAFCGNTDQFWEPLLTSLKAGSVLVTSPSHLSRLGGLSPLPAERRPSAVLSGGAPLPNSAVQATRDVLGCATREFFGSTEAGVIASRLRQGERAAIVAAHARPHRDAPRRRTPACLLALSRKPRQRGDWRPDRARSRRRLSPDGTRRPHCQDRGHTREPQRVRCAAGRAQGRVAGGCCRAGHSYALSRRHRGAGRHRQDRTRDAAARSGWDADCVRDLSATLPSAALPRRWRFVSELPTGPLGKASVADLAALFDVPQAKAS